ncbi:unnamed protein product [Schistosoma margrebowiei]|uniref:Uncharacterized protein n=1 Tax=Schistosoma margrebowiei TaxID=48269 RepID=A0A183MCH1_9TREM|nr:unnamed protein product [Schistosoma margrebowiei]
MYTTSAQQLGERTENGERFANKQVKRSIGVDKKKYVEEQARLGNVKLLYDTTKKLAGKYSKPVRLVKDKEGRPITDIEQQQSRWVEYFEELLNSPAPMNPPDIKAAHTDLPPLHVNPPTTEQIRMAIKQVKSGKSARPDNVPAEALKSYIDGETLEDVDSFTYQGSVIDELRGSGADVMPRIGKAWTASLQLENIWNSKQLSVNQYQSQNLQYQRQGSSTVRS